ncbi:hypothetical protein DKX38_022155 [Salix brachista]|uniref:TIR domain-containing protein n=2 Tax=Salix TaxID=40685 RepID=A0A5N5K0P5_9ROSI|nr:hypothetical protein DKX38_022155 [Salix brachista]
MPNSLIVSSSPAALRLKWDVFLSFRGEDTRHGFTENLYESLSKEDIRVFLDNSGMAPGDEIDPTLMEAIEDSALSIIILSPRYANSHWCLEEVARICELRRLILPVFYQVDPSHIRRQKGPLEQDFMDHMERFGEEKVGKWREAMKKVGGISGFFVSDDDRSEKQLIPLLGNRVLKELRKTPVDIATYTVGLDSRVENFKRRFIDDRSNRVQGTEHVQGITIDFEKKKFTRNQRISWVRALNPCPTLASLIEKCMDFLRKGQEEGEMILDTEGFKSMVNLRLLQINHAKLQGKFKSFPAGLKWLQWKNCPMKNLPSDYAPHELAVLDLSESGIERVWGWNSNKLTKNLMVMNLRACYNLVACPDLSGCKTLAKLDLQGCVQLTKVHKSVGNATTLIQLNLNDCSNLVEFPSDVSGLKLLQNLNLVNCPNLKELPLEIGSMNSLKLLLVDKTAISVLPESICRLTKLEKLSLNGCRFIKSLPERLGNLISLKELSLNESAVEDLPDSVRSLTNLEKLSLMWCESLTAIPESVGNLQLLTELSINRSAIKELPPAIGSLPYLKTLSAGGCRSLTKLPDSIGGLASISELDLDETSISNLPEQIGGLKMIEKLYLRKCTSLRSLPESSGNMWTLTTLNLFGCNIIELPESIGMLENLVMLRLHQCRKLQKLPDSIGNLKSLCHLLMDKTAVTVLPGSFGKLSNLMILRMRKEPLESLGTQEHLVVLPGSFSELSLLVELNARAWRISGKIPEDFKKLSSLEILDLGHNNFSSLPSSLCGLTLLRKLDLPHCKELESLPPLPSSLEEVDVSNCVALEAVSDVSNLRSLTLMNMTNCEKVKDIPGIECLEFLKRLYMSNCKACSLTVKRRLSKVCLRNIRNLSMPGSKIPDWFSQDDVQFSERRNHEIKAVIVGVVVSLGRQTPEHLRYLPVVPDIQVNLLDQNKAIFSTTLFLQGIPNTHEDQIHLCRYSHSYPLVLNLKDGIEIQVRKRNPPVFEGVELKKWGIHLVYENDDDYGGNEESLDESQQSVSQKLANFFNSYEEDSQVR